MFLFREFKLAKMYYDELLAKGFYVSQDGTDLFIYELEDPDSFLAADHIACFQHIETMQEFNLIVEAFLAGLNINMQKDLKNYIACSGLNVEPIPEPKE